MGLLKSFPKFGVDAAKSTLCRWLNSVGLSYLDFAGISYETPITDSSVAS